MESAGEEQREGWDRCVWKRENRREVCGGRVRCGMAMYREKLRVGWALGERGSVG